MVQPKPDISVFDNIGGSIAGAKQFSHQAMATIFEIIIVHKDSRYAQQAAEAAFCEIDRLEAELSRFIENSDISQINNLAVNEPLRVGLATFECLEICRRMYTETGGAFDVTIGSLMSCWLGKDKTLRTPSEKELSLARQRTGMHLLKLDKDEHTVQVLAKGVQIDLGGFGKGYAVDKAAELLGDWGIEIAFVNGGGSSVLAFGEPGGTKGWPVTLSNPCNRKEALASFYLRNRAMSSSGLEKGPYIFDPRVLMPVKGRIGSCVCAPDAATADALSTAFMVMSPVEVERYCASHSEILAMIMLEDDDKEKVLRYGRWEESGLLKQ